MTKEKEKNYFKNYEERKTAKEDKKKAKQKEKAERLKKNSQDKNLADKKPADQLKDASSFKGFFFNAILCAISVVLIFLLVVLFVNAVPGFIYEFARYGNITNDTTAASLVIFALHCGVVLYFLSSFIKFICGQIFKLTQKSGKNILTGIKYRKK